MALTREALDRSQCDCGVPGCEDRLVFACRTCGNKGLEVGYFDGILTINCRTCEHLIVEVHVARKDRMDAEDSSSPPR